ncbi:hypothetical protein [Paraflavitalea pollutisoli]|uniref:hypothetical protein n=1 Tax=Paraflavitalea pollutisoli TaxID=3034143 RepID=UPI0023ED7A03|nr:hypothetical protein [Paraflavitalea sp. H1-2-19X]
MKKIIDQIYYLAATVYRTLEAARLHSPHFRMVVILAFGTFLLATCIAIPLAVPITTWSPREPKIIQWLKAGLYFGALFILFGIVFRKRLLDKKEVTTESIRKCKRYGPWIFFGLILLMTALLIKRGIDMGTIKW